MTFDDVKDEIHGLPTRTLTSHELEMFAERVWQAAQEAERKKILEIVKKVGIKGNHNEWFDCCDTIVERIKNG